MLLNSILISLIFSYLLSFNNLDFIYLPIHIRNHNIDIHLSVFPSIYIIEMSCFKLVAIVRIIFLYYCLSITITIMSFAIMKSIYCKFHQNYYLLIYPQKKSKKKVYKKYIYNIINYSFLQLTCPAMYGSKVKMYNYKEHEIKRIK